MKRQNDDLDKMPLSKQELARREAARDRMAEMRVHAAARRAAEENLSLNQTSFDKNDQSVQELHTPENIEFPEAEKPRKKKQSAIGSVLSGSILSRGETRKAYPYLIFCALLMFLYIANAFRGQSIYREHAALTEQVKELRSQSMTIASEKMQATRQSRIIAELERRGIPLKESLTPNKVIPR